MTKPEYLLSIKHIHASFITELSTRLIQLEAGLDEKVAEIMGNTMLCYYQAGEFKYGFSSHEKHVSFHNMVMYCYPHVREEVVPYFKKTQLKKSCINFTSKMEFPLAIFEEVINKSQPHTFPKPRD